MKFLSELRTCCGGATVTKAVEGLQPEEKEAELNRSVATQSAPSRKRKVKNRGNWKPVLHVISEDKTITDVDRYSYNQKNVRIPGIKVASKVGVKSAAKGRAPKKHGMSYWEMSYAIGMPAFSGTLY
ncbi:PREDICTED: uncharacterized protein LOC109226324 [Nicotiana attenuata]|uniref:Uncharacterized protein n=1 Tax=Nicotiana attenuata TaxID=49451 RepID=A0A1J6IGD6_NICAT|nr:PREDICTED: uncharacterized protein LOC109226324 [Nicotiana attenuata]OIT03452.1 hypothetical protein A4A49_02063 [Nicotiana attenuata]